MELVLIYIKLSPIEGMLVDPKLDVGLFVFVDLIKVGIFPEFISSFHSVFNNGSRYSPEFPNLGNAVSVIRFLSYFVRL